MTVATVRALFDELRAELVPIVQAIAAQPPPTMPACAQTFPEAQQLAFGLIADAGLRLRLRPRPAGQDASSVLTKFASGDVRITTRVRENDLGEALFSTLHEAGHALYEQGIGCRARRARRSTPAPRPACTRASRGCGRTSSAAAAASGSTSIRLLRKTFPDQLGNVPLDTFYRAINKVERSLIRTDADEVTYNLHVMLRFDFELELLEGRLKVNDLPEAWRARFKADFGIAPPDDRDGCLQDVHWYAGTVGGAFQGYTIGNILSAQFYGAALKAHPEIADETANGEFATLHCMADAAHLSPRPQVRSRRDRQARDGQADVDCALHRLPARQVWRAVSSAAVASWSRILRCRAIPG